MATDSPVSTQDPVRTAFRVSTALALLSIAFQFVTAGRLFPEGGPEQLHSGGAIVLHVVSGLAALSAVLLWRRGSTPASVGALAVVVFVATFVQAAVGGRSTLWIHVPGAMVLTVGAAWLTVLAWRDAGNR